MKYLTIKRKQASMYATWMNLVNSIQSERNQSKRPHIMRFHFYEMSKRGISIETESRLVVDEGWRNGGGAS